MNTELLTGQNEPDAISEEFDVVYSKTPQTVYKHNFISGLEQ